MTLHIVVHVVGLSGDGLAPEYCEARNWYWRGKVFNSHWQTQLQQEGGTPFCVAAYDKAHSTSRRPEGVTGDTPAIQEESLSDQIVCFMCQTESQLPRFCPRRKEIDP